MVRESIPDIKHCNICNHDHPKEDYGRRVCDDKVVRLQAYCVECRRNNKEHPDPQAVKYVEDNNLITTDLQLVRQLFAAAYPNNKHKRGWYVMVERLLRKGGYLLTSGAQIRLEEEREKGTDWRGGKRNE